MTSGRNVHTQIKGKISELESGLNGFGRKISKCEDSITQLMDERENYYGQLATFYLPELDAASLRQTVNEVQSDVKKIFREKQARRKELEAIMDSSLEGRQKAEAELDTLTSKLNVKAEEREKLRKIVATELRGNENYAKTKSQASQENNQLADYHKRFKQIEKDAHDKLPAYEENKLFMYLVNRNFGTEKYVQQGLIAKLDKWVAKIIHYEEAKQSYDFLQSVHEIMKEEVQEKQRELNKLVRIMQRAEKESSDKNGLTKVTEEGTLLAQKREKLIKSINEYNSQYSASEQERKTLDGGKDDYYNQAVGTLKDYLKGETIADLKRRALETSSRKDDSIVAQIEEADSKIKGLKEDAKRLKSQRDKSEKMLEGLRTLQQRYRKADYDSDRSYFRSGFDFSPFLIGYLAGTYSQAVLWDQIKSNHRFREVDSYDSYSSSYSHYSNSFSSSSGFGGGGFSSGGGFGGGGFSSGGGF